MCEVERRECPLKSLANQEDSSRETCSFPVGRGTSNAEAMDTGFGCEARVPANLFPLLGVG